MTSDSRAILLTALLVAAGSGCSGPSSGDTLTGGGPTKPGANDGGPGPILGNRDGGTSTPGTDAGATTDPPRDAGTSACHYPPGPYGLRVGDVLDPNLKWEGYAENATAPSTIRITDLFDCDGSRGIHALLIDNSTQWCEPCQEEAKDLGTKIKGQLGQDGVHVLSLLIEDVNSNPASVKTAGEWRNAFGLAPTNVVADPGFTFQHFQAGDGFAFPTNVLVNPRTMKIVFNDGDSTLDPSTIPDIVDMADKLARTNDPNKNGGAHDASTD